MNMYIYMIEKRKIPSKGSDDVKKNRRDPASFEGLFLGETWFEQGRFA